MSDPTHFRERTVAFAIALLGSALPFSITYHAYGAAVERNPVVGTILDIAGWPGLALAVSAATLAAFAVFQNARRLGYPRVARAGMWTLAGWCVVNSVNDVLVGHAIGVSWADVALVTVAVATPALFVHAAQQNLIAMPSFRYSRQQVASLTFSALIVMSVLAGTLVVSTGPALAATYVGGTFEDGTKGPLSAAGTGGTVVNLDYGSDSYAIEYGSGDADINTGVSYSAGDFGIQYRAKIGGQLDLDQDEGANNNQANLRIDATNNQVILQWDDGSTFRSNASTANIPQSEWLQIQFYNNGTHLVAKLDSLNSSWSFTHAKQWSPSFSVGRIRFHSDQTDADYLGQFQISSYADMGSPSRSKQVTGRVTDQSGDPVSNATVSALGVNFDQLGLSDPDKLEAKANDLLKKAKNARPDEWDPDLSITGSNGLLQSADSTVVVAHRPSDWNGGNPTLTNPRVILPTQGESGTLTNPLTGETYTNSGDLNVALSVWDPTKAGLFDVQNNANEDLPGKITNDRVVIKEIGPGGSVVSERTPQINAERNSLWNGPVKYTVLDLDAGIYRVHPKGNPASAYLISVGDPEDIFHGWFTDLRDKGGDLIERAQWIQDKLDTNQFWRDRVVTNESGYFTIDVPQNVKTASLMAHKGPIDKIPEDPRNITLSVLKQEYDDLNINDSLLVPAGPRRVRPPADGVTIPVYEQSVPGLTDLNATAQLQRWKRQFLDNLSWSDLPSRLTDRVNATERELNRTLMAYRQLADNNDRLARRIQNQSTKLSLLESRLAQWAGGQNVDVDLENFNSSELAAAISAVQTSITELKGSLDVTPEDPDVGQDSVTQIFEIAGPVPPEAITVFAEYSNGTQTRVSDEYLSIDRSVGANVGLGTTTVRIEDYPLGETDPSAVSFRVEAATQDGVGRAESPPASNPTKAAPPGLQYVKFSTLSPDQGETVTLTVAGREGSAFNTVENVTVVAPDGTRTQATSVAANKYRFTPDSQGRYVAEITYSDLDGNTYTVRPRIAAASRSTAMPGTIRLTSSPAGGRYALVGDGLSGATVGSDIAAGTVDIAARIPDTDTAPGSLSIWANTMSLPEEATINVVATRPDSSTLDEPVGVTLRLSQLPSDGLLYRKAADGDLEPFPAEGSAYGSWERANGQTLIRTATDDAGKLTIKRIGDPSLTQRLWYRVQSTLRDIGGLVPDIPGIPLSLPFAGSPAGLLVVGLPLALAIPYRRR